MHIYLIFLLTLFITGGALGQSTLTIRISNLRNDKGLVYLELLDENENSLQGDSAKIGNNSCTFTLAKLTPERYAFKFFHDENENRELDTNWLGIPKEGFGFSNNPKSRYGPPDFELTIFDFKQDTTIVCLINYL
ncbi:MAG: hypothetical protein Kow00127_20140 [Bacteroidales bacterium]